MSNTIKLLSYVIKLNDSKLNELIHLYSHSNPKDIKLIKGELLNRLTNLYNPSTGFDYSIEFIKQELGL